MNTKAILTPEEQDNYRCNAMQQQQHGVSEKEIETELYALLLQYHQRYNKTHGVIGQVSYNNPHHIDGLLTISTTETTHRILIEAKTHRALTTTGIWAPLSQALQYVHLLHHLGELLPGVILIAAEREWHAVQVDTLVPLLSRSDLPWESTPSERSPEIEAALQKLNPHMLSYTLDAGINLNEALGAMNTLLQGSSHVATKHHGDCTAQSGITIEIDPTTHIYHSPSKQWWRYQGDSGIWSPIEQRVLTLELREQALRDGIPSRGIGALIKAAIEEGRATCTTDEWPSTPGLINTPQGTWDTTSGEIIPSTPRHNHRHSTGVPDTSKEMESSPLAMVVARALRGATGLSSPETIYCITQDESEARRAIELLSRALGTYAIRGNSHFITSQWKWNPDRGGSPILLVDGDVDRSHVESMTKGVQSQARLRNSSMVVVFSKASYDSLSGIGGGPEPGAAITWVENIEDAAGQILSQALRLMDKPVELISYANNDMMLAWFNECLESKKNHYILFTELFESYNEFLVSRGNLKVSMRFFSESIKKHNVFIDNKLVYTQRAVPGSHMTLSSLSGKTSIENVGGKASFVANVAFA